MKYILLTCIALTQAYTKTTEQSQQNATKPKQPVVLEHSEHVIISLRKKNLEDNVIYFGVDASGRPCRKKILEHAKNNPDFGAIKLISFHPAYWFFYSYDESFNDIGTYSNEEHLALLKGNMSNSIDWDAGGVWCPEINTMIGGTKDTAVCDRFVEYMKTKNKQ